MPNLLPIPMALGGLGSRKLMATAQPGLWSDCDKARVLGAGVLAGWGGCQRLGEPLYNPAIHGEYANKIGIFTFDAAYMRKKEGHGMAAVDLRADQPRILSLCHNARGDDGRYQVGVVPVFTDNTIDNLEFPAVSARVQLPAAATSNVIGITIDGEGTPDTFTWTASGGGIGENTVPITGDWQELVPGLEGFFIRFNETTGHDVDGPDNWAFTINPTLNDLTVIPGTYDPANGGSFRGNLLEDPDSHIITVRIASSGTPDTFSWFSSRGGGLSGNGIAITGGRQLLFSGVSIKFGATTGHGNGGGGDTWVFTAGPRSKLMGYQNRQNQHNFPDFSTLERKILITSAFDAPLVNDGKTVRPILRPPHMAAVLVSDTGNLTDLGATDEDPTEWEVHGDNSTGSVVRTETNPTPAAGSASVQITVPVAIRKGKKDLAFVNDVGVDIVAACKRIRVWIYGNWRKGRLDRKILSLVLATGDGLTGTRVEIKIKEKLRPGRWQQIDLPWKQSADFTCASVGLRLSGSISKEHFQSGIISFFVDAIECAQSGGLSTTETSETLDTDAADVFAVFTHYDPETGEESGPSPEAGPFSPNASGFKLELTGYYPGIQEGLQNTLHLPAVHVYMAIADGDFDQRQDPDGEQGILAYRRVTPDTGFLVSNLDTGSNDTLIFTFADEKAREQLRAKSTVLVPFYNHSMPHGDVAAVIGKRVVVGNILPYVGHWTVTNGSQLVLPYDSDTLVGPWLEGRHIVFMGESKKYEVFKALDTDGDGVYDALWIGSDFDTEKRVLTGGYEGIAEDNIEGTIEGNQTDIFWSNVSTEKGVDAEHSALTNRQRIMPAGEEIRAIIPVGGFTWIMGKGMAAIVKENTDTLDDLPAITGPAYMAPEIVQGLGIVGKRAWCPWSDVESYCIGSRGEVIRLTANGHKVMYKLSEKLAGLVEGWGRLADTAALRDCVLSAIKTTDDAYLHLSLVGGVDYDLRPGLEDDAESELSFEPSGEEVDSRHEILVDADYDTTESSDTIGTSGEEAQAVAFPLVHLEPLSAHPTVESKKGQVPASPPLTPWVSPWDEVPGGSGDGLYIHEWLFGYIGTDPSESDPPISQALIDLGTEVARRAVVKCDWVLEAPKELPEETGSNANHDYAETAPEYDPPWHSYRFNEKTNGYFRFRIAQEFLSDEDYLGTALAYENEGQQNAGERYIFKTATHILLWIYLDAPEGADIPADTFSFALVQDPSIGDTTAYRLPVSQIIYGGFWNLVALDLSALPTPVGSEDDYDVPWDDVVYWTGAGSYEETINVFSYFRMNFAIEAMPGAECFTNGLLDLYITGGRQVFGYDTAEPPSPAPSPFVAPRCEAPGSVAQDGEHSEFGLGVLLDLKREAMFTISDSPVSSVLADAGPSCVAAGVLDNRIIGGRDGWIYDYFNERINTWGSPDTRFVFKVKAGSTTTRTYIDKTFAGTADVLGLAVDQDGTGKLVGLVAAKWNPVSLLLEFGRIISNDTASVEIETAWTEATAADYLIIGPLAFLAHFSPVVTRNRHCPTRVSVDAREERDSGLDTANAPHFVAVTVWKTFVSPGNANNVDPSTVAAETVLPVSRFQEGKGFIPLNRAGGKATSVSLMALAGMTGALQLRNIQVQERILAGDAAR